MRKLIVISTFIVFTMNNLFAQNETPPPEVIKAANENFIKYLTSAVTEDTKTLLGFSSNDNLSQAVLGIPYKIYNLSADSIKNYNGTSSLKSIITETNMWYFPIMIDSTIKMILYVGKKDSVWMRAGLGSAGLAKQMQNITKQWTAKDGYTPMFIQQYNIGSYLYSIPQVDSCNLTETGTASNSPGLGKKSAALKPLNTTIKDLQNRITQ